MGHRMSDRVGSAVVLLAAVALFSGCPNDDGLPPGVVPPEEPFYVGYEGCASCHANIAALHARTGHAQALNAVLNESPMYPPPADDLPSSPPGLVWGDIAYVIGGYDLAARFVTTEGFVHTGPTAQFDVAIPEIRLPAGFVPHAPGGADPLPFDYETFYRLTTGPVSIDDAGGRRQDNRPGIGGLWAEPGVQCEACHGPGSMHIPNPTAGNIILDAGSGKCAGCHGNTVDSPRIIAGDGFIQGFQQSTELLASPHAGFSCTFCHNPHASTKSDPAGAIRNQCQACHPNVDMGLHEGFVFVQGDHVEPVTCVSCHMPFAVKTRSENTIQLTTGETARFGDTQSHIFRLDPSQSSLNNMFTDAGASVARDPSGQAGVSTCFVCQRCHSGLGNAFAFPPDQSCAYGEDMHLNTDQTNGSVVP